MMSRRERPACVHHWRIEIPAGPRSDARCLRCDAVRQFANSLDVADWLDARDATWGARVERRKQLADVI